ncbi:DUF6456 domain-containing protein [Albimonas sp. CAU 1670]|uniref:DUF6456 domain-containing protein n=1 Tax=Albimonas sp. CAU 1670 TaxID=3032599 RepID=UPI0023DA1A99|nr:DUF6456 domain-containing protein [Albimonas sp. CAU 1670]MDF2231568.1 DUF6456 domain-containing protein [Albimonas sp. CAU 1670]
MPAADPLHRCRDLAATRLPARGAALRAEDAAVYLAHVACGEPLRRIAAASGRHPSTILRAVRRVEQRRDDPLFDDLLSEIESVARAPGVPAPLAKETALPQIHHPPADGLAAAAAPALARGRSGRDAPEPASRIDEEAVDKEARRILRRLCEPRAFLALARGAQVACVFRKSEDALVTLARTPLEMARAFAARDWIGCVHSGSSMARYEITSAGRSWLRRTLGEDGDQRRRRAEQPSPPPGLAEAPSVFARQHQLPGSRRVVEDGTARDLVVNLGETPLGWLARRRGPDGKAFLTPSEIAAGERLREDFERAQMGPRITQDWRRFLTPGEPGRGGGSEPSEGPATARRKVAEALAALGPGLNDAVLRACCFLEGLEATERRMGWAARSGKVVLKIALSRLAEHYGFAPAAAEAQAGGTGRSRRGAA